MTPPPESPRPPGTPDGTSTDEHARDAALARAFTALSPPPPVSARLEDRFTTAFAAESRSLAAEWIDLFRVGPARALGRTLAAGAGLAVASQLGLILLTVLLGR